MVDSSTLEERIRRSIPKIDHLEINDLTGTKDHYQATIVSAEFEGKSKIEQHQLVYRALGELMAGPVHALALHTYTPSAWQQAHAQSSPADGGNDAAR